MAAFMAPYNASMQLGAGFNSYTQQLCIDQAVINDEAAPQQGVQATQTKMVPQAVTYKTQIIDKVTDVYDAMKINGAFDIKFGAATVNGSGEFVNSNAIKDSDISFLVTVKVVNQIVTNTHLTKFNPIPGLTAANFTRIYGDSYISGFVEGGDFTAIISVKAKDRRQVDNLNAKAKVGFTSEKITANLEAEFKKDGHDFLNENETSVSVIYIGGGQELKDPKSEWTFETMRAAALKFPEAVAQTPMRTHALLTRFDALRSFHTDPASPSLTVPAYEKASVYTSTLQDAFLDYKAISKSLQLLAFDVTSGTQVLKPSPKSTHNSSGAKTPATSVASSTDSLKPNSSDPESSLRETTENVTPDTQPKSRTTPFPSEPYDATVEGVEEARTICRHMMTRIVAEVDHVTAQPDIAFDETRQLPYMSPFLFKQLLPIGVPVPPVVAIEAGKNPAVISSMMKDMKVEG